MGEEFTFTWIQCQWRQIHTYGTTVQITQILQITQITRMTQGSLPILPILPILDALTAASRMSWRASRLPQLALQRAVADVGE